jgi:hypothetical protein
MFPALSPKTDKHRIEVRGGERSSSLLLEISDTNAQKNLDGGT